MGHNSSPRDYGAMDRLGNQGDCMSYAFVVLSIFLNGNPVMPEKKFYGEHAWDICEVLRDEINEQGRLEARCTMAR